MVNRYMQIVRNLNSNKRPCILISNFLWIGFNTFDQLSIGFRLGRFWIAFRLVCAQLINLPYYKQIGPLQLWNISSIDTAKQCKPTT